MRKLSELLAIARFVERGSASHTHICNDGCYFTFEKIGQTVFCEFIAPDGALLDSKFVSSKYTKLRHVLEFCDCYL